MRLGGDRTIALKSVESPLCESGSDLPASYTPRPLAQQNTSTPGTTTCTSGVGDGSLVHERHRVRHGGIQFFAFPGSLRRRAVESRTCGSIATLVHPRKTHVTVSADALAAQQTRAAESAPGARLSPFGEVVLRCERAVCVLVPNLGATANVGVPTVPVEHGKETHCGKKKHSSGLEGREKDSIGNQSRVLRTWKIRERESHKEVVGSARKKLHTW